MLTLLLLFMLQWNKYGPTAGVELDPTDPKHTNMDVMVKCINVSNGAGCVVTFKPGTYHLPRPIVLANGVVDAYFTGVKVIPCGKMDHIVSTHALGPWKGASIHNLYDVDISKPCGSFTPFPEYWEMVKRW